MRIIAKRNKINSMNEEKGRKKKKQIMFNQKCGMIKSNQINGKRIKDVWPLSISPIIRPSGA